MLPLVEILKECVEGDVLVCMHNDSSNVFFTVGDHYNVEVYKSPVKGVKDRLCIKSDQDRVWMGTTVVHFIKV